MTGLPWLGFQIPAHCLCKLMEMEILLENEKGILSEPEEIFATDSPSPFFRPSCDCISGLLIPIPIPATAPAAPSAVMSKRPNPTIQSYFSLVPKPITPPKNKRPPTPPPSSPWTPQSGKSYKTTKIGSIEAGPKRIFFTGRVANFREQEKNSKKENAARLLIRMTIADETGVIDVSCVL